MATQEPILIICPVAKIHKPKPKRINKKSNIFSYNKKNNFNNKQIKQRTSRIGNHEHKKNIKNNHQEKFSFNLDMISLQEIENDFKIFKSKSEEIEEQRELIKLIGKADDEYFGNDCYRNSQRIKRPQKPFCKIIE